MRSICSSPSRPPRSFARIIMRLNIFLFTITAIIIDVVFALPASSSSASGSAEPPKTSSKKPFDLSTKLREELEFDTKVLAVTMGIGYAGYLAAHAMELIHGQPYRILRAPNRRKYRVTIQQGIDFDNCLALMVCLPLVVQFLSPSKKDSYISLIHTNYQLIKSANDNKS